MYDAVREVYRVCASSVGDDRSAFVLDWVARVVGLTRGEGTRFGPIGKIVHWQWGPRRVAIYGSKAGGRSHLLVRNTAEIGKERQIVEHRG